MARAFTGLRICCWYLSLFTSSRACYSRRQAKTVQSIFGMRVLILLLNAGNLRRIITQPIEWNTLVHVLPGVLMFGALAVTRNKWYHMAIAIIAPLGMLLVILNIL